MNKGLKISLTILLAILFTACAFIDCWYLWVRFRGSEKIVETTYKVGLQETTDGEQRHFIEVNYMSNDNNNGLEMFEVKYNYMLDESQEDFYSQGLQYVSTTNSIGWDYYKDSDWFYSSGKYGSWPNYDRDLYYMGRAKSNNQTQYYNYMSGDDYETTLISSNPVSETSLFKIQIGEDLFLMKFKDDNDDLIKGSEDNQSLNEDLINSRTFISRVRGSWHHQILWTIQDYDNYYVYQDHEFLSSLIYDSIQSLKNGQSCSVIFEFADMFDYFKYDKEQGAYSKEKETDTTLIEEKVRNYFSIYVNISADGARSTNDSMFNCVLGNSNYNTTGNYISNGYFTGKVTCECSLYDFDYVSTNTANVFQLTLSPSFKNKYDKVSDLILLNVYLDLDELFDLGISVASDPFADGCFDGYTVTKCTLKRTVNGEILEWEVEV